METNEIILTLANKLGIATEQIFAIFSESIKGIAALEMVILLICIIGLCLTTYFSYRFTKMRNYSPESDTTILTFDNDDWFEFIVAAIVFGAFWVIICTVAMSSMQKYYFPEYYAVKEMLALIK